MGHANKRKARGGVSPTCGRPATRGLESAAAPAPPAAGAVAFPNFTYHGGPVIASPQVYTSFWGNLWSDADHQARAERLNQFHRDLLESGFMNVLSQYGVGRGAGNAGTFAGSTFISDVPDMLTNNQVQSTIQSAVNGGILPEPPSPSNIALIIYLDENIGIEDPADQLVLCEPNNDNAFGYHEFFTTAAGNQFYYAIVPALSDACISETCPGDDSNCSLHLSQTQEQRQTQVASHEFAEMTTDPQLNAWFDPDNGENGDICNGQSDTVTVGTNTWTVQKTYSSYDDSNSGGTIFCIAQASDPERL